MYSYIISRVHSNVYVCVHFKYILHVGRSIYLSLKRLLYNLLQFDIPALFIEWTSLLKTPSPLDGVSVLAGVDTAIEAWYKSNPCGRVIVVHDCAPKRGGMSIVQKF